MTVCNHIDCSLPGSSVHGIFFFFFFVATIYFIYLFILNMELSRQEYWSGLPCPSPGDLPALGVETVPHISCIGRQVLHQWGTWESPGIFFSSVQFSSVTQLCRTLCDLMNRSTPSLPVHHQLAESAQTHVHWVSDAIQPSHPLLSPSLPAPNPSQHQGLFQWVNSLHEVAKVLEFQL